MSLELTTLQMLEELEDVMDTECVGWERDLVSGALRKLRRGEEVDGGVVGRIRSLYQRTFR